MHPSDPITVVPPAAEPVTLAEAKLHLRVDHAAEDGLITKLIAAARQRWRRPPTAGWCGRRWR